MRRRREQGRASGGVIRHLQRSRFQCIPRTYPQFDETLRAIVVSGGVPTLAPDNYGDLDKAGPQRDESP